jgi:hypothetical protein
VTVSTLATENAEDFGLANAACVSVVGAVVTPWGIRKSAPYASKVFGFVRSDRTVATGTDVGVNLNSDTRD